MSITALPCLLCAVFTMCFVYKGHAFNCHIKKRKTCLTNHKGSISLLLMLHTLRMDTHTNAYSHHGQKQFQDISHALAKGWCMPGLKIPRMEG